MLHAVNINYECQLHKNSSLYFLLNNSFSKEKRKSMGFSVMMVSKWFLGELYLCHIKCVVLAFKIDLIVMHLVRKILFLFALWGDF